jgi:glycerophosphoryl diester phosphodiesterase
VRPAEWHRALVAGAVWAGAWAFAAFYLVGRSLPLLPAYLDGHRPLRVAARRAWSRTRGSAGRLLRLMSLSVGGWLLIRAAADAAFLAGASVAVQWVAAASQSLRPIVLVTAAYAASSFGLDAVIGFLGFSFVATVLTKFYYEDTDLHTEAPPVPNLRALPGHVTARLRPWLRPSRVLPMTAVLVAIGFVGSGLLLERVPEPRHVVITAHRAGLHLAPENTLAALERSIAAGVDFAEIDVQLTRDSVAVVVHDADLMRVAGDPRRIAEVDHADIADVVQGSDAVGAPPDERRVATLDEFLVRADGRIGLNVELKYYGWDPRLAREVVRRIRARGMEDQVVIMSLSLEAVRQVREIAPDIVTGYLTAVAVGDISRLPVQFLAVARQRATPRLIRAARDRGLEVHVWTVNRPATIVHVIERGADGFITDDPVLGVRVRDELTDLSAASRLLLRFRRLLLAEDEEPDEDGGGRTGGEPTGSAAPDGPGFVAERSGRYRNPR